MTVDHKYCNFRSKTNDELAEICKAAMEKDAYGEAYHAAIHHQMLCHPMMGPEQLDFFDSELPVLSKILTGNAAEISSDRATKVNSSLSAPERMPDISMPEQVQQMISTMLERYGEANMAMVTLMGMWVGTSLSIYVGSKGEGCVFSLINADLCKEAMA